MKKDDIERIENDDTEGQKRSIAMIEQGIFTKKGTIIHIRPRFKGETSKGYRKKLRLLSDEDRAENFEKNKPKVRERMRKYMIKYRKKHRKPKIKKKPYTRYKRIDQKLRKKTKLTIQPKKRKITKKPKRTLKKRVVKQKVPQYKCFIGYYRNGKFKNYMGKYTSLTEARRELSRIAREVKKPIIPESVYHNDWWLEESCHEYVLMAKGGSGETLLQNEYGKYALNLTNKEGWTVIDKAKFDVEETFWVWGHDKRRDRKDFTWIYENILLVKTETKYDFIRIYTYRNKVLFKDDYGNITLVICKVDSSAVKLYNKLQEFSKKARVSNVVFSGDFSSQRFETDPVIMEIKSVTGWPLKQIQMYSTTYSLSKKRVQDRINYRNSKANKDVYEILKKYETENNENSSKD